MRGTRTLMRSDPQTITARIGAPAMEGLGATTPAGAAVVLHFPLCEPRKALDEVGFEIPHDRDQRQGDGIGQGLGGLLQHLGRGHCGKQGLRAREKSTCLH